MDARKAMIVWEPAIADSLEDLQEGRGRLVTGASKSKPEIQVFDSGDAASHDKYDHLSCSMGDCLHGWGEKNILADVFRTFLCVIQDGVPLADVHREFLKLDVYADMVGRREYFGISNDDEEG